MVSAFHPILNCQIRNAVEVLEIVGNNRQPLSESLTSNQHVKFINKQSRLPQHILQFCILTAILRQSEDMELLKQFVNHLHLPFIIFRLYPFGVMCAIIKLI